MARRIIRVAVGLGGLAAAIYFIATDTGPHLWLAQAQATLLHGEYYPGLTALLVVVLGLLPVRVVARLVHPRADRQTIDALKARPLDALAAGPIVLNGEYGGATLSQRGVELRSGKKTVFCPWRFFAAPGVPLVSGMGSWGTFVVPVNRSYAGEVELRSGDQLLSRGAAAQARFFRYAGRDQVRVSIHLPLGVTSADLANLLLQIGRASA